MTTLTRPWRKSKRSNPNGACLEAASAVAANTQPVVLVRDGKLPASPVLAVSPQAWARFVASLRHDG